MFCVPVYAWGGVGGGVLENLVLLGSGFGPQSLVSFCTQFQTTTLKMKSTSRVVNMPKHWKYEYFHHPGDNTFRGPFLERNLLRLSLLQAAESSHWAQSSPGPSPVDVPANSSEKTEWQKFGTEEFCRM